MTVVVSGDLSKDVAGLLDVTCELEAHLLERPPVTGLGSKVCHLARVGLEVEELLTVLASIVADVLVPSCSHHASHGVVAPAAVKEGLCD